MMTAASHQDVASTAAVVAHGAVCEATATVMLGTLEMVTKGSESAAKKSSTSDKTTLAPIKTPLSILENMHCSYRCVVPWMLPS